MPVWYNFPLLSSWIETNLHRKDESKEQKRAAVEKTAGMRDANSLWQKECWCVGVLVSPRWKSRWKQTSQQKYVRMDVSTLPSHVQFIVNAQAAFRSRTPYSPKAAHFVGYVAFSFAYLVLLEM